MLTLTRIQNSLLQKSFRVLKVLRFGKTDVRTADEIMPFGVDSNPIKNMLAIYASTSDNNQNVIIGYINKNQIAREGEFRTYSTDADGAIKFSIYQKNDGTCEIGGNTKNMVRFQELESGFNQLKNDHNDLVNKYNDLVTKFNTHIHSGVTTGPGTSGPTTLEGETENASSADISGAKIDEIKTL
ncbi:MAG TPA: hypothetical protein VL728_19475 [Cyclobacteriaceae bacterium]|jgi:hypothetical protein|nr:hypothetical protein [Cyclobacteriaceae bacterium]